MKKTKISVVIPCFNRKGCVMDAVRSVLLQRCKDVEFEVVVVDDGSTDGTKDIFKKRIDKVKFFRYEKNKGVNYARQYGTRRSRLDYVLFLDSDDMLSDNAFENIHLRKEKLKEINLFGTVEKRTKKKMFSIKKEGYYPLKYFLSNEIGGELIPLISRRYLMTKKFDIGRFCFERVFWFKLYREKGAFVSDAQVRLYSFDQQNRVTLKLHDPKNSLRRYNDYIEYAEAFKKDYLNYGLNKELSRVYRMIATYAMISSKKKEAREALKESGRLSFSMTNALLFAASFVPGTVSGFFFHLAARAKEYLHMKLHYR